MSDPVPVPENRVTAAQNSSHGEGHDYDKGSPHLRHSTLRQMVEGRLRGLVADSLARSGQCRVLEVGGGHGTFTRLLLEAGADVTVTEASSASADLLRKTFGERVRVIFDETGELVLDSTEVWDLAVMTSVIHHIPDYLTFLQRLALLIAPEGSIFTVADPLFYPRMSQVAHKADRVGYLSWRLLQGNYARGLATRLRRLRGVYDDNEASDLVEYHVVRRGVDEEAIRQLLTSLFGSVEVFKYWSNQAPLWQRLGERTGMVTAFGIEAKGRVDLT